MVEGEKVGTLDLVAISGDSAKIETVQGGFDGLSSVVRVGDVAYVLDDPLRYLLELSGAQREAWTCGSVPIQ